MDNVADQIKAMRLRSGLSQERFGKKYQIPKRSIQNWESGISEPSAYVLYLLTRVIDMDYPRTF